MQRRGFCIKHSQVGWWLQIPRWEPQRWSGWHHITHHTGDTSGWLIEEKENEGCETWSRHRFQLSEWRADGLVKEDGRGDGAWWIVERVWEAVMSRYGVQMWKFNHVLSNQNIEVGSFPKSVCCCCLDKDELERTIRIMDERADHGEVHERASWVWQAWGSIMVVELRLAGTVLLSSNLPFSLHGPLLLKSSSTQSQCRRLQF